MPKLRHSNMPGQGGNFEDERDSPEAKEPVEHDDHARLSPVSEALEGSLDPFGGRVTHTRPHLSPSKASGSGPGATVFKTQSTLPERGKGWAQDPKPWAQDPTPEDTGVLREILRTVKDMSAKLDSHQEVLDRHERQLRHDQSDYNSKAEETASDDIATRLDRIEQRLYRQQTQSATGSTARAATRQVLPNTPESAPGPRDTALRLRPGAPPDMDEDYSVRNREYELWIRSFFDFMPNLTQYGADSKKVDLRNSSRPLRAGLPPIASLTDPLIRNKLQTIQYALCDERSCCDDWPKRARHLFVEDFLMVRTFIERHHPSWPMVLELIAQELKLSGNHRNQYKAFAEFRNGPQQGETRLQWLSRFRNAHLMLPANERDSNDVKFIVGDAIQTHAKGEWYRILQAHEDDAPDTALEAAVREARNLRDEVAQMRNQGDEVKVDNTAYLQQGGMMPLLQPLQPADQAYVPVTTQEQIASIHPAREDSKCFGCGRLGHWVGECRDEGKKVRFESKQDRNTMNKENGYRKKFASPTRLASSTHLDTLTKTGDVHNVEIQGTLIYKGKKLFNQLRNRTKPSENHREDHRNNRREDHRNNRRNDRRFTSHNANTRAITEQPEEEVEEDNDAGVDSQGGALTDNYDDLFESGEEDEQ